VVTSAAKVVPQYFRGETKASKGSNKAGRVALVCRIVSLRALAAFIATHLEAELVQRRGNAEAA